MGFKRLRGEEERAESRRGEKAHSENLPRYVGDPVFLQLVPLGVLHQVCDGASTAELHHQL